MPAFVTDTFTDTNGTNITSHTGEVGATWTKHASANNTNHPQINGSNQLVTTETSKNENYYASGTPTNADYTVTLEFTHQTSSDNIIGPAGRMSTSVNTGYFFIWFQAVAELRLYKYVSGTLTQIGSGVAFAPTATVTYRMTLDMSGATIACRMQRLSDNNWITSAGAWQSGQVNCISQTDSAISAAGKAGFWFSWGATTLRPTVDNFSANEAGGGGGGTVPLNILMPHQGIFLRR